MPFASPILSVMYIDEVKLRNVSTKKKYFQDTNIWHPNLVIGIAKGVPCSYLENLA
jgi:hypothetical protein